MRPIVIPASKAHQNCIDLNAIRQKIHGVVDTVYRHSKIFLPSGIRRKQIADTVVHTRELIVAEA